METFVQFKKITTDEGEQLFIFIFSGYSNLFSIEEEKSSLNLQLIELKERYFLFGEQRPKISAGV